MGKHTPGPWSIEPQWSERNDGSVAVVNRSHSGDDWDVCQVHSSEANARLIAASPELLSALIAMEAKAGKQNWNDQYPEQLAAAQAAIAKATGAP